MTHKVTLRQPDTLGDVLDQAVAEFPEHIAYQWPEDDEAWPSMTFAQAQARIHHLAAAFLGLGIRPGDPVAIMAPTRLEWVLTDLALNIVGITTTAIYPNSGVDHCAHILRDSHSVAVVVEDATCLERMAASGELDTCVAHIVRLDGDVDPADPRQLTFADLEASGRHLLDEHPSTVRDAQAQTTPATLATLFYTSGTTGVPKGVELTHANWVYVAAAMRALGIQSDTDVHYLWLPMSHVFGKALAVVNLHQGVATAVDGRLDRILPNLQQIRPTIMCGVPRIFEKLRAGAMAASGTSHLRRYLWHWASTIGREAYPYRAQGLTMPPGLAIQFAIADRIVFNRLRAMLGGRLRRLISGSAKLSPQVQEWFYSAGVRIEEGYGSTETTGIAFFDWPDKPRFGSVGPVCPGSQAKIAEDGEILLKGGGVFRGYRNAPQETAAVLENGWFKTGDVGHLREDGSLVITDRKKDVIKTSGGKYVSPQKVEAAIMANVPYVSQAVVAGEGRKYASAILVMDRRSLLLWAAKRGVEGDYAELSQHPDVRRWIEKLIARANAQLERWETVKRFTILDHELTSTAGEVTPSLKIRRRQAIERYRDLIDQMYDDDQAEASPTPVSEVGGFVSAQRQATRHKTGPAHPHAAQRFVSPEN